MLNKEEIQKAVGIHGLWKQRLLLAIGTGKSEFAPEKVKPDNLCDFGKWLHGVSAADKASDHWKQVQALHSQFHQEAGRILEMALAGKKAEATAAVGIGSAYVAISGKLTAAMMAWSGSL